MEEKLFEKSETCFEFSQAYFLNLANLMNNLNPADVEKLINIFDEARILGKRIFFAGNGGSAATANHFANDLGAIATLNPRFKAISLVNNTSSITAIANDYGYEHIFVRQIEPLFEKQDVLVAISASGNSKNIVNVIEYANKAGGISVGLVGFDGGIVKKIAHHSIHVNIAKGEYGPVEDIHMILDHLITSFFLRREENQKETL